MTPPGGASFLCTPEIARLASPNAGWVYLGKDLGERARIERRLGKAPLALGGLFHAEARRLRQPFLDLVASLGRSQPDPAAWWAGTLPWKDSGASDLFLLACWHALCLRLAERPELLGAEGLTLVIEDPWLFCQLRRDSSVLNASFHGSPALWPRRLACLLLGAARRLRWALRMARGRALQSWHCRGRAPKPPGGVAIYSHLMSRSLEGAVDWKDHYLPGLAEELGAELPVSRFTNSDLTGFERELGQRRETVAPLILYASWRGFLRALFSRPPAVSGEARLDGRAAGLLLEREWFNDLSRPGRCAYLLFYDCAREFFRAADWKAVVFPWENQPQERMMRLAAAGTGIRLIGHQHTTVPSLQLPFFLGAGEERWAPLPDVIVTSGPYPHELLKKAGYPASLLIPGGSRRYGHGNAGTPPGCEQKDVLVVLPIEIAPARHLLAALARAYPRGGETFAFRIKTHPAEPLDLTGIGFPAEEADAVLSRALERCGPVIFSASTSGAEALLAGHPVLRYRPEALLDLDPCEMLSEDTLPTAGDEDIGRRLEAVRFEHAPMPPAEAEALFSRLFAPVDKALWLEAVLGSRANPPPPSTRRGL